MFKKKEDVVAAIAKMGLIVLVFEMELVTPLQLPL
jgi:hypothetical protein